MHWKSPWFMLRGNDHKYYCSLRCAGVLLLLLLSACAKQAPAPEYPASPPVSFESPEFFVTNLFPRNQELTSWNDLASSVRKSLAYVNRKPQSAVAVQRPGLRVTWGDLSQTLTRLQTLLPRLDAEPQLLLQHFQWVQVPGGINYSGYYEPTVRASRTRKPGYTQPIYRVPPDLHKVMARRGKYYDRRTIEEGQILAGKGLELAWAADPVDAFYLEIQGSGRLLFDDGTQAYVNYAGQNGHKYKSSGRIMREKGLLKRGDIFEQREWFKNNPDRVREILNENPSYVFFKFGTQGPTGAMGYEVEDWRTLATDRHFIPLGAVVAYGVNAPDENKGRIPLRGIGFAQDVGGAIKRNRIDIFCGGDRRANYVASFLDAKGPAWVLLAK
ncbi:MAG: MltA domain-containing protein [Desulfovibrio sp.]|nr:MltA domain-containing protein [Desulfovibrio sp.]